MSAVTRRSLLAIGAAVLVAALLAILFRPESMRFYAVPQFWPMTAAKLSDEGFQVLPVILETVYGAFAETDETAIYDTLAEVSAGKALETLYLERIGAMAGGGLDASDQQIHEMKLLRLSSRQTGTALHMAATWQVVGTVGHATHLHVRGNTYAANLTFEPVDGAWRMTTFDLTDVDRSDAGTLVAVQ